MAQDPVTYRHPRTLEQAFGPHTRRRIDWHEHALFAWIDPADRPVLLVVAVCSLAMGAAALIGLPV